MSDQKPDHNGLRAIVVKGAREHNLKNVDVTIPRNTLTVVTGLSGSGKSSLAFDTLYAEGQRRYVESLSAYARQFLGQMEKPDVDDIQGLSPAISIDQKSTSRNPRSTVGTVTEIYDYLRLLYARIGTPHCPQCGNEVTAQSAQQIVDRLIEYPEGTRLQLLAPLVRGRKGEYRKLFEEASREGFARARVDGEQRELREFTGDGKVELDKRKKHTIEIIVDRIVVKPDIRKRLTDSTETALRLAGGLLTAIIEVPTQLGEKATGAGALKLNGKDMASVSKDAKADGSASRAGDGPESAGDAVGGSDAKSQRVLSEVTFSEALACVDCGISMQALEPRLFSFNSPFGACAACSGLGAKVEIDPEKVIPDRTKSIEDGAIVPWSKPMGGGRFPSMNPYYRQQVEKLLRSRRVKITTAIEKMPEDLIKTILYGSEERQQFQYESRAGHVWNYETAYEGVINNLRRRYDETSSDYVKEDIERFMSASVCVVCKGSRLKPEALAVKFAGLSIHEVTHMPIDRTDAFFRDFVPTPRQQKIAEQIFKEIRSRLGFLTNVGLGYLDLGRSATTLSGGESQRIRLATQIGSSLVGVMYILDEPSIGLHQRDNDRLLGTLKTLRDLGNTLIIIEHDEDTMREADIIIDVGPGAGAEGGEIIAIGPIEDIKAEPRSITGAYLSGRTFISVPPKRRKARSWIEIANARANNLDGLDVKIPVGVLTCVTGVSGSGKSTFVHRILAKCLQQRLRKGDHDVEKDDRGIFERGLNELAGSSSFGRVKGTEVLDKLVVIDQSPIGRTPRSNPATYTGTFDIIRDLFSQLPDSKIQGYLPGRFSFNVKGGRCEACQGDGIVKIEMHFLPDVYVPCEVCKGRRYNAQTLEVKFKGKSIADVLDMRVDEALAVFSAIPRINTRLQTLCDVGLGYVKLGQPATQLSGGEAQRVKLATELAKRATGKTFYILDEPTTGLHFADIHKLLDILQRLVDMGNSVLVIEHNLDVIKTADWVLDLGPEGGRGGGLIVAEGTPEKVAAEPASHTGRYLARVLSDAKANGHIRPDPQRMAQIESDNLAMVGELVAEERIPVPT